MLERDVIIHFFIQSQSQYRRKTSTHMLYGKSTVHVLLIILITEVISMLRCVQTTWDAVYRLENTKHVAFYVFRKAVLIVFGHITKNSAAVNHS